MNNALLVPVGDNLADVVSDSFGRIGGRREARWGGSLGFRGLGGGLPVGSADVQVWKRVDAPSIQVSMEFQRVELRDR